MKRNWRGFTLVEVSLFLAITAVVFVGVAVGTQNSIFQQRYNDAVQNFAEFLRTTYSQVMNVQNNGTGRSDQAIYGKLVVFGNEDGNNKITSYNVIGKVGEPEGSNVLTKLASLGVNIYDNGEDNNPVGIVEDYRPRWGSQIQTNVGYNVFQGALLIVRHPSSGTVYTFVSKNNDIYNRINNGDKNPLRDIDESGFSSSNMDFCVNPNGAGASNLRRDVRIVENARNASGIEILPDGEGCNGSE